MLGELCYWIFNMSIVASFMGLIVVLIRRIRFIPHRVSVFLWIIPFVRMVIPFVLNSPFSLMALISGVATKTVTVYVPADDIEFSALNCIRAADSYTPVTFKVNILDRIFNTAGLIWIIGALTIILVLIILYATTMREIRDSKHLEDNIYLSGKVEGPAVYGIIKPRIVLPTSYGATRPEYVLQHERMHIRRKDNFWRLLGFLAVAIHWFNPFSWLLLKVFLADIELACDEAAVSQYSAEERKDYARALLDCSRSKSLFASAFGGAKVRTRIENVLSYKKMTVISSAGFTILILTIIYALLTNAG